MKLKNNFRYNNKFLIADRNFLSDPIKFQVAAIKEDGTYGISRGFRRISTLKAAVGEHVERVSGFKNGISSSFLRAFNLYNGEEIIVPTTEILLNHNLKPFYNSKEDNFPFRDTCGYSAHVDSYKNILNGLLEFIERQSFIHTWLIQYPHKKIKIENVQDKELRERLETFKSNLDFFELFNISFWDEIPVVLMIGGKDEAIGVGCSANISLEKSIEGAFDEFWLVFDSFLESTTDVENTKNIYLKRFSDQKATDIKDQYSFLLYNEEQDFQASNNFNLANFVKRLFCEYGIETYACMVPINNFSKSIKTIKIISPQAYPHMNTEILNPDEYNISKNLPKGSGFININKPIPFP